MDRLTQLRNQYLELTNRVLPGLASSRKFPVRYNHCFQRIIIDNLFGRCWYEVLERKRIPASSLAGHTLTISDSPASWQRVSRPIASRSIAIAFCELCDRANHRSPKMQNKPPF